MSDDQLSLMDKIALLPDDERDDILRDLTADDLASAQLWLRPRQLEVINSKAWLVLYMAGRGAGKALWNEELIPTPAGWKCMGDLVEGDEVFDHAGNPTSVRGVFPQGEVECSRVSFTDGTSIVASNDHLWTVFRKKNHNWYTNQHDTRDFDPHWWAWTRSQESVHPYTRNGKTVSRRNSQVITNAGAETVPTTELIAGHTRIPVAGALKLSHVDLPIDPYVFGAWLGDGTTGSGHMCAGAADAPWMMEQFALRGYTADAVKIGSSGVVLWKSNRLHEELKAVGLSSGRKRPKKAVPAVFLRSSYGQRLDFIRGLMDTDGGVSRDGKSAEAGFINFDIASALEESLRSIGYITRMKVKQLKKTTLRDERPFFRVQIRPSTRQNPFCMPRKASLVSETPRSQSARKSMRMITSIESVGKKPATCITVSAESALFLAGRSMVPTHNSRTGAHWVIEKAKVPGTRIALLGRTVADVRDVMVSGESGVLSVSSDDFMPDYMPSVRRLVWPNGSSATTYTSEASNQLRGPQQHFAWADELAAFKQVPDASGLTAWDNLQISTRLGEHPQILATTTPKRTPAMKELLKMAVDDPERIEVITGSTLDNKANLSESYIRQIYDMYSGTSLERQELFGEMINAVEGALWLEGDIQQRFLPHDYKTACVPIIAVDPAVTSHGDMTGISVMLTTTEYDLNKRHVWVVEDLTVQGPPELWSKIVADAYRRWGMGSKHRPIVVAEGNQGYEMIRTILMQEDPTMALVIISAKLNKQLRAQPVSFAYKRGRVFHTKTHDELEQEMFDWEPTARWSPNRMDAMVHGVTSAIIDPRPLRAYAPILVGHLAQSTSIPGIVPSYRGRATHGLSAAPWRGTTNGKRLT